MKTLLTLISLVACASAWTQIKSLNPAKDKAPEAGVSARIKDFARFRGIRDNQLQGIGLVFGLSGTGDSKKNVFTPDQVANLLTANGQKIDPKAIDVKNVAAVLITATLPPFARNGQRIDVTISSLGDAKSLAGGTLLMAPLRAPGDDKTIFAMAQGTLVIGGFSVTAGGNQSSKGTTTTTARIPNGAIVENGAPTKLVDENNHIFIELDEADITTAGRLEEAIQEKYPAFNAVALDGGTIQVTKPANMSQITALAKLEDIRVEIDSVAKVIIQESTGTIIMGGDLKIGAASIVHGSLTVEITEDVFVSQPEPLSKGTTEVVKNNTVKATEDPAKVENIKNTTVADLANLFQKMKLSATDVISILQALKSQGALKARIVSQ